MVPRSQARGVAHSEVCLRCENHELRSECGHFSPDGPALRSTTLITYANWLMSNGNSTFVTSTLWPVIKLDLDYVATFWNQSTCVRFPKWHPACSHFSRFDLWEEINSSSFFTTAVQHRALREGSALATRIGQTASVGTYDTQAANVLCFLQVTEVPITCFQINLTCIPRVTGIQQRVISPPTLVVADRARTRTPSSHPSTHGTSTPVVMLPHSSRAPTRHYPT